jgi:hypothetical protein
MEPNSHREVRVHIDEHPHHSPNPTTGAALYALGKVRPGHVLYKEVEGDHEDEPIANDAAEIRLSEDEHFHSAAAEHHRKEPRVFFEDMNTNDDTHFRTPWNTTLSAAWDEAATKLEPRTSEQRLQTPGGVNLTPYLGLTLRELKERQIVAAFKFQIVGPTGGA